ncbi:MAG: nuclear transport factor 2 family protein [Terriglobales bacterium]
MSRFLTIMMAIGVSLGRFECDRAGTEARMGGSIQEELQIITVLREAYAAFNRGDIDFAVMALDEHIEWSEPAEFPGGGTYHGREGARRYLAQSRASLAEGTSEPVQFIPARNRIVVFVHAHVRPQGSRDWHDIDLADVYTIRDGKRVEMRAFADRQEALHWAGARNAPPVPGK